MKNPWCNTHLTDGKSNVPFSFTHGGLPSAPLLAEWSEKMVNERLDAEAAPYPRIQSKPATEEHT